MRGICIDTLNNPPTYRQLLNLSPSCSIRVEMRDNPAFYDYIYNLPDHLEYAALVGPSTEDVNKCLSKLLFPTCIIIGNEPDITGDSSWTMTQDEYIDFWNKYASIAKWYFPGSPVCTAGMYTPEYLAGIWGKLSPEPNMVNRHYPDTSDDIVAFRQFGVPVIVGETCYATGTAEEILEWQKTLNQYSNSSFWFSWNYPSDMALVTSTGRHKKVYNYYKEALKNA